MNYSEESYVRLYTRRTLTSVKLGWEGRAVLHEVMKVMDLSGVLEVGDEPAEALALLAEMPLEVVKAGLQRLLATKTWELRGTTIIWGTFEEAQTCSRSDKIRKREERARKAAGVQSGHAPSQPVQDGPVPAGNVTLPPFHPSTLPPTHPSPPAAPVIGQDDPEPEPGRETSCPLDLDKRLEANGTLARLAEQLPAPIDAVRHEAHQFVKTWTLGKLAGQKRTAWAGKLRQWIIDKHGRGELRPPGALAHDAARAVEDAPPGAPAHESFDDQERAHADRLAKAVSGTYGAKLAKEAPHMAPSELRRIVEAAERRRPQPAAGAVAGVLARANGGAP